VLLSLSKEGKLRQRRIQRKETFKLHLILLPRHRRGEESDVGKLTPAFGGKKAAVPLKKLNKK